ncbi:hypothetical protein scyTo_0022785 [Scyliorhinus torazame]|uniref:TIR domain-containing protein n=2 Tax=Scyliorhinus torazame TaxID=75743 RepID=A0A401Q7E2_SCYTO|nr:hypothetical protein [Scyliorhinus torazame]
MLGLKVARRQLLCALSCLLLLPSAPGYSFRNCIQHARHNGTFQCVHRFLTRVSSAVSDLPSSTLHLNISQNRLTLLPKGSFHRLPGLLSLRLDVNRLKSACCGVFSNLTRLLTLNLSHNSIAHLTDPDFRGLGGLKHLLLHHNRLATIQPDTFASLASLQILVLSDNELQNFSGVILAVTALGNLTQLDLTNNRLGSLRHATSLPHSLQSLYLCNNSLATFDCRRDFLNLNFTLDLSNNRFSQASEFSNVDLWNVRLLILSNNPLNVSVFLRSANVDLRRVVYSGLALGSLGQLSDFCRQLGGKPMKSLVLQGNQITFLTAQALAQCPPITAWDLSRNQFMSIGCLEFVSKRQHVVSFIVEHNKIQKMASCFKEGRTSTFPNLTHLSFRFNRIFTISPHAFSYAAHLQTLILSINNIAIVNPMAFSNLTHLLQLRLDNNLITDIHQETFRDLRSLRILNLRNNRISIIFREVFANLNNLDILDLGGNKIRSLTSLSFSGLHSLSKLYLDRNYIAHIRSEIFSNLLSLGVLDLASNWIRYNTALVATSPFVNLTKLYILKLHSQQPYGINIIPPRFFKGLIALRALYVGQNKMSVSDGGFEDLVNLRSLSMPDTCNGIHSPNPGIFKNLRKLEWLNLENVGLRFMCVDILGGLSNLKTLSLGKNAIQSINRTVLECLPSLTYLDLRKNPFPCTCGNTWFQNWSLSNPRVQVVYFYNQTCADQPTEYLYKFDPRICYLDIGHLMFQITMPILMMYMLLPIIYKKGYWHMKYGFYILRSWLHDQRGRGDGQQSYRYDAFISYNSNDEDWVLRELVPNLERKGPQLFKLCLHHRDFELGKYIIDNIVDSIYQSRKTICVMSRRYLESEWCSMELQLASYRLFHELKDIIILIFLEKIPEAELSTYHKMRKVMRKKTYIQWPSDVEAQKLFWVKVRDAIKGSSCAKERGPPVQS